MDIIIKPHHSHKDIPVNIVVLHPPTSNHRLVGLLTSHNNIEAKRWDTGRLIVAFHTTVWCRTAHKCRIDKIVVSKDMFSTAPLRISCTDEQNSSKTDYLFI